MAAKAPGSHINPEFLNSESVLTPQNIILEKDSKSLCNRGIEFCIEVINSKTKLKSIS